LFHDILRIYINPDEMGQPILPPATIDFPIDRRISSSKSLEKATIDHYNNDWQKHRHYFSEDNFNIIYTALARKVRHEIVILQLNPEETRPLVAACRENRATVASALTAAFLAAYQEIMGPFPGNRSAVQVPFDLRRRLCTKSHKFPGIFAG
jgi:hypothetical protein